jgi:hypothetical protein
MKATAKNHKPLSAIVTVPDPDSKPVATHVEVGGTLQWRSDSPNYPRFEIQFVGPNPFNDNENDKFDGENLRPVVMHLKKTGEYHYKIKHIRHDGTEASTGPSHFVVNRCIGCP